MEEFLAHAYVKNTQATLAQASRQLNNLEVKQKVVQNTLWRISVIIWFVKQTKDITEYKRQIELTKEDQLDSVTTTPDQNGFAWKLGFDHKFDAATENHVLQASVSNPDGKCNDAQVGIRCSVLDVNGHIKQTDFKTNGAGVSFEWEFKTPKFLTLCRDKGLSIVYEIEHLKKEVIVAEEDAQTMLLENRTSMINMND